MAATLDTVTVIRTGTFDPCHLQGAVIHLGQNLTDEIEDFIERLSDDPEESAPDELARRVRAFAGLLDVFGASRDASGGHEEFIVGRVLPRVAPEKPAPAARPMGKRTKGKAK